MQNQLANVTTAKIPRAIPGSEKFYSRVLKDYEVARPESHPHKRQDSSVGKVQSRARLGKGSVGQQRRFFSNLVEIPCSNLVSKYQEQPNEKGQIGILQKQLLIVFGRERYRHVPLSDREWRLEDRGA